MKSRFKPDHESSELSPLGDPEGLDASEQRFAATAELADGSRAPSAEVELIEHHRSENHHIENHGKFDSTKAVDGVAANPPELILQSDTASWRDEVAAKVNRYKERKPRSPRYPSLHLKFEPREPFWKDLGNEVPQVEAQDYSFPTQQALAVQQSYPVQQSSSELPSANELENAGHASAGRLLETTARILEFPRALVLPSTLDELAEPLVDGLRILDVPDTTPPAPALGGISIEPVELATEEKRPGIDVPLESTSMSRRLSAAGIDALLVATASALFAYVFFRITSSIPPIRVVIETLAVLTGTLWAFYQYLLLVHTGTTPGLKLLKLQLRRFDGSAVALKTRRWRVLASFLSALSLGLGYAWCFLDEDRLCWHDRITHTHTSSSELAASDLPQWLQKNHLIWL